MTARISEFRRIIAFRNILIHGYTDVDDRLVWEMVDTKLRVLTPLSLKNMRAHRFGG